MNRRAEYAQSQIAEADELKQEAMSLNANANASLKEAGAQARLLIEQAKNDSILLKESMLKQAKTEADNKIEAAQKEIEFQKRAMRDEVTKEIVDVAMAATEKLLLDKLTDDEDRKAIEKFVKEVQVK